MTCIYHNVVVNLEGIMIGLIVSFVLISLHLAHAMFKDKCSLKSAINTMINEIPIFQPMFFGSLTSLLFTIYFIFRDVVLPCVR